MQKLAILESLIQRMSHPRQHSRRNRKPPQPRSIASATRTSLAVAFLLFTAASLHADSSRLDRVHGQNILHLHGDPAQLGSAHGKLLADDIRANIDRLVRHPENIDPNGTPSDLDKLANQLDAALPDNLKQEMHALADSAGVSRDDILRLNAIQWALPGGTGAAFGSKTLGGRLIQFASLEAEKPIAAKPVILVLNPKQGLRSVIATWAGCIAGPAAINEEGISVTSLRAPGPTNAAEGLPLPIVARDVLADAKSLVAATRKVSAHPTAGIWTAIVADGKIPSARILEVSPDNIAELGPKDTAEPNGIEDALRRSNLPLSKEIAASVQSDRKAMNAEALKQRYVDLGDFLSAKDQPISSIDTLQWLRRSAAAGRTNAVQQVVLNSSDLEIWIACESENSGAAKTFHGYNLRDLFAGRDLKQLVRIDNPAKPIDPTAERKTLATIQPHKRSGESELPEIYRMDSKPFQVEASPLAVAGGIVSTLVKIPSPVTTEHSENNTIPAEVFHPRGDGPFPYVIVTHIAGGDFDLSRFVSRTLASNGIACVFIKLPYYGERRPPGKNVRMLSPDVGIASGAMSQAVQDIRRVCDWIAAQPDLDGDKIGICGISLGSITGALAIAIEPRITHACLIIGGGSLADLVFESVEGEAREYKKKWTEAGGTRESLQEIMSPFDPVTYPDRLRERVVLMINAEQDESVPVKCNVALWEAAGKQRIVWYPCGHYTIVQYLMPALQHTVKFFREWPDRDENVARN